MKKFLCILMTLCMCFSVLAVSASDVSAEQHINSAPVVVKGHLDNSYGGELISIKAESKSEGKVVHVGITECDSYGDYTYKFTADCDAADLTISVKQGDEDVSDSLVSIIEDACIYNADLEILNKAGEPFHYGLDTECVLRASIDNVYGSKDSYVLIIAFYDSEGTLIDVETKPCIMEFAKDGGVQTQDITISQVPASTECIKGFMFKSMTTVEPLAQSALYDDDEAYGLNNLNDEQGDLVIAYLGGSITAGAGADSSADRFSTLVTDWFREKYPNKNVIEHNAGVGGTGSRTGLVRLEKDIISANPDVVFVEFAVNDQNPSEQIRIERSAYYEEILRDLINLPKQPVIIMVYSPSYQRWYSTTEPGEVSPDSINACGEQEELAQHYGIGSVNFHEYVGTLFADNTWKDWNEYFPDGTHPTSVVYKEYADYIISCFETDWDKYFRKISTDTERLRKATGLETVTLTPYTDEDIKYSDGWYIKNYGKSGPQFYPDGYCQAPDNGSFTFEFTGSVFGLYGFYPRCAMEGGTYDIDNGKYTGKIEVLYRDTPTYNAALEAYDYLLVDGLDDCKHTVTVTADPATPGRETISFGWIITE